jgi:hypothetical protein
VPPFAAHEATTIFHFQNLISAAIAILKNHKQPLYMGLDLP